MTHLLACLDTAPTSNTTAVIDAATWCAQRLHLPLEFLHALERHPEHAEQADFSGAIGLGAQEALLQQLSQDDQTRSRAAREAGRALVAQARARAAQAGLTALDGRLRHGGLLDNLLDLQDSAALIVLGEHHTPATRAKRHFDHHLEQVVRSSARPVLVATGETFTPPEQVVIAFDGSPGARRLAATAAAHPLLQGLPVTLAMAGPDTPAARRQLDDAASPLRGAGLNVSIELLAGAPATALPKLLSTRPLSLLVMGAYSQPRWREWFSGSTTTALLRVSDAPVLVIR
jgi:nucleotide-binding universal stress UspA family protein